VNVPGKKYVNWKSKDRCNQEFIISGKVDTLGSLNVVASSFLRTKYHYYSIPYLSEEYHL
jgi:hypothetical protein